MVVLHELLRRRDAPPLVPFDTVGLAEEAALVAVDGRLDQHQAGEADRLRVHRRGGYRPAGDGRPADGPTGVAAPRDGHIFGAHAGTRVVTSPHAETDADAPGTDAPAPAWQPAGAAPPLRHE